MLATPFTALMFRFLCHLRLVVGFGMGVVAAGGALPAAAQTPTITNVTPSAGPMAGGTNVTITGTDLGGALTVRFGTTAATSFVLTSSTQITAMAPAGAAGTVDVTVTTTAGTSATSSATLFTYVLPPTANPVGATVAANSSNNPIPLNISGLVNSVAVSSSPSHGTTTASGTSITYTPTPGFSGNDSFHYTARNAGGTSGQALVTLTVSPPTISISPSTLSNGAVGSAYSATLATAGGTAPYTYSITAGSLPPGFSLSTTTGVLSGTPTASGTYHFTVRATDWYGATGSRAYSLNVVTAVPGAPTGVVATPGDGQAHVTFTAPASTGGTAITSYTVTANPGGATGTGMTPPLTVAHLTNGTSYTFTVTATNGQGTGPASGASDPVTPALPQAITFSNPGPQNFGTMPTLTASAQGGAVSFTSSTPVVCTVTADGVLTFVAAGTCTIVASQAGNASYLPALPVPRSFLVNAVPPGAPTIGTATTGDQQASVTFTAPASNGGTTITGYTVAANPGGPTGSGASSPIAVTGLANGQAYTFTVTAINSAGTGLASDPSNVVTPQVPVTGTVPAGSTGSGTATATTAPVDGTANPQCALSSAQFTGKVPPGHQYTYGTFEFLATGCSQGVTITLTYPQPLAPDVKFMKFGPKTAAVGGVVAESEWFEWPGTVDVDATRTTIRYTVFDNGVGDSDPRVGFINDPMAPMLAAGAGAVGIPTLGHAALALLSMLLGTLGWRLRRAG